MICPFCNLDQSPIWEGTYLQAIKAKFTTHKNHILIITKAHRETTTDMTGLEWNELLFAIKEIMEILGADGYHIGWNVGDAGQQTVFHVHCHVIPRWYHDGKMLQFSGQWFALNDHDVVLCNLCEELTEQWLGIHLEPVEKVEGELFVHFAPKGEKHEIHFVEPHPFVWGADRDEHNTGRGDKKTP
jgi:diadenosine tetraphosphate (Ap4A) HIT family hydrolase